MSAPEQAWPVVVFEQPPPVPVSDQCWCAACDVIATGEDHRCDGCREREHGDWNSARRHTFPLINPRTGETFWLDGTQHIPYTIEARRQLIIRKVVGKP